MASILALGLLLGGVTLVVGPARPASAHICTNPVEIDVGKTFSVNIGVAAEDKPITRVTISVPKGFVLDEPFGFLGWVGERRGDVVQFEGGVIEPYQCGFFTFNGTIPKKGKYVATIVATAEDGTSRSYRSRNPYSMFPAMIMYAGMPIPTPDDFEENSGSEEQPWRTFALGGAIGLLVVGLVWRVRSGRN